MYLEVNLYIKLIYYEIHNLMVDVITREKQLKNWKCEWKNKLINNFNHEWKDLNKKAGIEEEYIESIKAEHRRHSELVSESLRLPEIAGQVCNDDFSKVALLSAEELQNERKEFTSLSGI